MDFPWIFYGWMRGNEDVGLCQSGVSLFTLAKAMSRARMNVESIPNGFEVTRNDSNCGFAHVDREGFALGVRLWDSGFRFGWLGAVVPGNGMDLNPSSRPQTFPNVERF